LPQPKPQFPTNYAAILKRIDAVNPQAYGRNRNFLDGAVTYLSPYISRGVISTRQVYEAVVAAGYRPETIEKFIQELAWRDYWQLVGRANKGVLQTDFRNPQPLAKHKGLPTALHNHQTGITAIDTGIEGLYATGYLHNHLRMYVGALACNVACCHWKIPADWLYYHLLDADFASNTLSWQWVSGAFNQKIYYANQENINKYCQTTQKGTFLDVNYADFPEMAIPTVLETVEQPVLQTPMPLTTPPKLDPELPTLVYNFYNLDPCWRSAMAANRILLLEASVFEQHPVSPKSIDFCLALAKDNIPGIQVWVAEFDELRQLTQQPIYFKEHPLNNYSGQEDARDWLSSVQGDFSSFFSFWKRCQRELL